MVNDEGGDGDDRGEPLPIKTSIFQFVSLRTGRIK
jgi:hypothetical protein